MKKIGLRIKEARLKKGLKQDELAARIGAKSGAAVSSWEVGKAKPDCTTLLSLCEVLGVSSDELLGLEGDSLSASEHDMIRKYRYMDSYGKRAVEALIDVEYERALAKPQRNQKARLLKLDFYNYPASAGIGNFLENETPEELWVKDSPLSEKADYVISISGDSMEPTYHDGDLVLVEKCPTVSEGEIGIFIVNGDAFIKELGDACLLSHNPTYTPIKLGESDSIYCCGRVLGAVEN